MPTTPSQAVFLGISHWLFSAISVVPFEKLSHFLWVVSHTITHHIIDDPLVHQNFVVSWFLMVLSRHFSCWKTATKQSSHCMERPDIWWVHLFNPGSWTWHTHIAPIIMDCPFAGVLCRSMQWCCGFIKINKFVPPFSGMFCTRTPAFGRPLHPLGLNTIASRRAFQWSEHGLSVWPLLKNLGSGSLLLLQLFSHDQWAVAQSTKQFSRLAWGQVQGNNATILAWSSSLFFSMVLGSYRVGEETFWKQNILWRNFLHGTNSKNGERTQVLLLTQFSLLRFLGTFASLERCLQNMSRNNRTCRNTQYSQQSTLSSVP